MLSRSVVIGTPDASEIADGEAGSRSRTCVSSALDKHIPPRLSQQRLEPLLHDGRHDFEVAVFPHANHALVETTTGLTSEMLRSDRFAPGLFARVATWLRAHGL